MDSPALVVADRLLDFATAVYAAAGLPEAAARLCADTLVQADLWGHQSHGVMRLPWYVARLKSGAVDAQARPEAVVDAGAITVIDGHDAMGQVLAEHGMREAIRRAKTHGVGIAALRNSNHFGTAMYFTLMAAKEGCVAFLATNASPAMAPWGGREKTVGTNPWSWAAPAGRHAPMVLDIANTGVARGKIYLAQQKKLAIPAGWALNAEGETTTDPAEALRGITLPMAQHKGYAIAVMMDMLSGVLSGGAFGKGVSGPYQAERRGAAGHFMIVMDIAAFQPPAEFGARMESLIAELKSVPLAKGFDEVVYPGELEARNDAQHRTTGLQLPHDTVMDLARLADEIGCRSAFPF